MSIIHIHIDLEEEILNDQITESPKIVINRPKAIKKVCPIEHTITLPFYAVLDFDESSSWVEDGKIYIAYADENNPDGYLYDEQSIHNQVKAKLSETMSPHYDIIQTTKQIYIVFYCVEECPYLSGIGQRYRDMLKSCTEIRADREDFKMVIKAVVDALKKEK